MMAVFVRCPEGDQAREKRRRSGAMAVQSNNPRRTTAMTARVNNVRRGKTSLSVPREGGRSASRAAASERLGGMELADSDMDSSFSGQRFRPEQGVNGRRKFRASALPCKRRPREGMGRTRTRTDGRTGPFDKKNRQKCRKICKKRDRDGFPGTRILTGDIELKKCVPKIRFGGNGVFPPFSPPFSPPFLHVSPRRRP